MFRKRFFVWIKWVVFSNQTVLLFCLFTFYFLVVTMKSNLWNILLMNYIINLFRDLMTIIYRQIVYVFFILERVQNFIIRIKVIKIQLTSILTSFQFFFYDFQFDSQIIQRVLNDNFSCTHFLILFKDGIPHYGVRAIDLFTKIHFGCRDSLKKWFELCNIWLNGNVDNL